MKMYSSAALSLCYDAALNEVKSPGYYLGTGNGIVSIPDPNIFSCLFFLSEVAVIWWLE